MQAIHKRRLKRVSRACENCRKRKIKCTGGPVCEECAKYGDECTIRTHYREPKLIRSEVAIRPSESVYGNKKKLEIPDYLSVSGTNDTPEYFGPSSNFSFVNQLNHYLKQFDSEKDDNEKGLERFGMKPLVLEHCSAYSADLLLESITDEAMNKLLVAYLETWNIPCPLFDADQLFLLGSQVWRNPNASKNDSALLYLILSLGATTSYFDIEESSPDAFPIARGFFNLASHTVPTIFSQVSFEAVRIIFFMGVSACNLGDTSLSYIYTGLAVRIALAIGLHKNAAVTKTKHSFDATHHHRVWACVWHFEKYWSVCVGRPSTSSEYIAVPEIDDERFAYPGYGYMNAFRMTSEHMRLRVQFCNSFSKINAELYNTKNDLLTILSKVEQFSGDIDNFYFNCKDKALVKETVENEMEYMDKSTIREWFWIRIYYLYLKVIIFRPFLIFNVYLRNTSADASESIRVKIQAGSDSCVNAAIELSNFIIELNNKCRMVQPIVFISTYLESASTVLLFYIVSSLANIPDGLARKIWNILQDIRSFLNGSYGSYLGTTKILARDGLESLHNVLKKRRNEANKTYLDKIIKPVVSPSPVSQAVEAQDDIGLEEFWLQTLDWISYL